MLVQLIQFVSGLAGNFGRRQICVGVVFRFRLICTRWCCFEIGGTTMHLLKLAPALGDV